MKNRKLRTIDLSTAAAPCILTIDINKHLHSLLKRKKHPPPLLKGDRGGFQVKITKHQQHNEILSRVIKKNLRDSG